jgi:predicted nucleotidyltransferase component of viral defense system
MEYPMNLHTNTEQFLTLVNFTAEHFHILPAFIEKDYWITRSLQRMSQNKNADRVVFKGGTALSKAFRLTNRFSEDIDIAVIDANSMTGNQLKMLIKRLAKDMAHDLEEKTVQGVTSKGSRFYRSIYLYPNFNNTDTSTVKTGQLLIEINTYGNPYPYVKQEISSFISDYLTAINRQDLLEQYNLKTFAINVLDKRRTILEKLVSLLRFSFSEDTLTALAGKIRHFYDLYYLINNEECADYIQSSVFYEDLQELFVHDQTEFDTPQGWTDKMISESPLIHDFPPLWQGLRSTYQTELRPLAFIEILDEQQIEKAFMKLIEQIKKGFI